MGNDRTLEKHRLSIVKVLDIPKDVLSNLVGSSLVKSLNAVPLKSSLNLISLTLLEVQDLVVLQTQRTPLSVGHSVIVPGGPLVTYDATRGMCVLR